MAPCRLLASHTYARTRGWVGDTPRSTSSKNVLKANTCILRRLGYPPPSDSPSFLFPPRGTRLRIQALRRRYYRASSFYVLFPPIDTSVSHLRCTRMHVRSWESISKLLERLMMMLISLKCSNSKLGWKRETSGKYVSVIFVEFYWKPVYVILVMHMIRRGSHWVIEYDLNFKMHCWLSNIAFS